MPESYGLDQAIDHLANFIDAESYERYLKGEWANNRKDRKKYWDEHYDRMDTALADTFLRVLEQSKLSRDKMNLMLVGTGYSPVGNEISKKSMDLIYRHVKNLVVVDISQDVAASARENFIEAGMPKERIHAAQFDFSTGMSTVQEMVLHDMLAPIETEKQMVELSKKLECFDPRQLKKLLVKKMEEKAETISMEPPRRLIAGGRNTARTLRFTMNQEPMPMNLIAFQMVLAGMGAAGEHSLWEKLSEVTGDPNHGAEDPKDRYVREERIRVRERVHQFIANFNTYVAIRAVRRAMRDNVYPNSQPVGYAYTDVSTIYYDPQHGEMPRLHTHVLKKELGAPRQERPKDTPRINTTIMDPALFKDEPEHMHGTRVLEFRIGEDIENGTKQEKPAGEQQ